MFGYPHKINKLYQKHFDDTKTVFEFIGLAINIVCFLVCAVLLFNNIGRDVILGIYVSLFACDVVLFAQKLRPRFFKVSLILDVVMLCLIALVYFF